MTDTRTEKTTNDGNEITEAKKAEAEAKIAVITKKCASFLEVLYNQVYNILPISQDEETKGKQLFSALSILDCAKDGDNLEKMLVAQAIALHNASMACFRLAVIPEQPFQIKQGLLNEANKLTRSYAVLLESLNRYRGKGVSNQKVTVEHVHVYKGGKAIVGTIGQTKDKSANVAQ
jgi:hypothetical protein